MDVKELIKWLFQVKKPVQSKTNYKISSKTVPNNTTAMFVFLFVFMSFINMYNCDEHLLNIKSDLHGVTRENESPAVHQLLAAGDSKSEINSTQTEHRTFQISEKTREDFKEASGFLRRLRDFDNVLNGKFEEFLGQGTARTFGRPIKKLQAMMIPLMFKLGVISTIIMLTFLLALKSVAIGKMILLISSMTLMATLSKLLIAKKASHEGVEKQVHLHIHNSGSHMPDLSSYGIPFSSPSHHSSYRRVEPYAYNDNSFYNQAGYASVINTPFGRYVRTGDPTGSGYRR